MIEVKHKSSGLVKDRFYHGKISYFNHVNLGKCFRIDFPSGNSCWYSCKCYEVNIVGD